jgi:hypothetical protein
VEKVITVQSRVLRFLHGPIAYVGSALCSVPHDIEFDEYDRSHASYSCPIEPTMVNKMKRNYHMMLCSGRSNKHEQRKRKRRSSSQ